MYNYTDRILIDLVGTTNYFQYENKIFSAIYKNNTYNAIKSIVLSHSYNYEIDINEDLNFIGLNNYSIEISNSDNHNGCKRVVFIYDKINKNKLVYKSKSLNSEPKINHLFNKLNEIISDKVLITPLIISAKKGYFTEYVISENNNNIEDFLIHFGQLLPFVKILGISDLHIDNIIIKNNKICIVDFESILNYSSLRVEILKNFNSCSSLFDEFSILDSLLINPKGNSFEIDEIIKASFNIDEFCLSNKKFINLLLEGIQKSILEINKNKEEIINTIEEEFKIGISSRFILRPTAFYCSIIKIHYSNIHNLKSFEDLKQKIYSILKNSNDQVPSLIIESEVESLSIGDIPIFQMQNNQLIVNNKTIYTFKNVSILQIIKNEVNSAIKTKDDYVNYFELKEIFLKKKNVFESFSLKKIVSCDNAGFNDSRLNYMGIDLYSGYPGFTLAFFNDEEKFQNLYTNYLSLISESKNKLNFINLGGAFEGLISFLYYLLIILKKYQDKNVVEFIENQLVNVIKHKLNSENYKNELMNGIFGQIAILDQYQTTFDNLVFDNFISEAVLSPFLVQI
jgi:lantibiotic modifying enzyme